MNNDISNNDSKGINPFSNMISELENDKYHSHQSLLPLLEHKSFSFHNYPYIDQIGLSKFWWL